MTAATDDVTKVALPGTANTVIYCHGIFNTLPEEDLRLSWNGALFGVRKQKRTFMAYWVDAKKNMTAVPGAAEKMAALHSATDDGDAEKVLESWIEASDAEKVLRSSIENSDEGERKESEVFVDELMKELEEAAAKAAPIGERAVWEHILFNKLTIRWFSAEVNNFLFNKKKRDVMVNTVKNKVKENQEEGPFVVIGHSQGSMVTYEALMALDNTVKVDLYLTIGSPLGFPPVFKQLHKWHGKDGKLPIPPCVKRWVNIAGNFDIICLYQKLGNEFGTGTEIVDVQLEDGFKLPPDAHLVSRYLGWDATRKEVKEVLNPSHFPTLPV